MKMENKFNLSKFIILSIMAIVIITMIFSGINNRMEKSYWKENVIYGNWEYYDYQSYLNSNNCLNPSCSIIVDLDYKRTQVKECSCENGNILKVIATSKQTYYDYKKFNKIDGGILNETI